MRVPASRRHRRERGFVNREQLQPQLRRQRPQVKRTCGAAVCRRRGRPDGGVGRVRQRKRRNGRSRALHARRPARRRSATASRRLAASASVSSRRLLALQRQAAPGCDDQVAQATRKQVSLALVCHRARRRRVGAALALHAPPAARAGERTAARSAGDLGAHQLSSARRTSSVSYESTQSVSGASRWFTLRSTRW